MHSRETQGLWNLLRCTVLIVFMFWDSVQGACTWGA